MATMQSSGPWRLTTMVGGPFDGQTYRDRYPHGLLPTQMGLPCPTEPSGYANYRRDPAEPQRDDGRWDFHYLSPWVTEAEETGAATPLGTTVSKLIRIAESKTAPAGVLP